MTFKACLVCCCLGSVVLADDEDRRRLLGDASLDQLLNTDVISVSKKEQKLSEVASAVFVISSEDIRRSTATSIPELLRMVPGLQVARINAHEWAITARGFNGRWANKLLVLIDGRTIYTPTFSGVYWDMVNLPLEDIDRIEVIRGPGATMWGANAVNGVINILTKSARDTVGGLVTAGAGNVERGFGSMRYGAALNDHTWIRGYGMYFDRTDPVSEDGPGTMNEWKEMRGGFRLDWEPTPADSIMVTGDLFQGRVAVPAAPLAGLQYGLIDDNIRPSGGHVLTRWTRTLTPRSEIRVQFYYDAYRRPERLSTDNRDTLDFKFEHLLSWSPRNQLLWGANAATSTDLEFGAYQTTFQPATRRGTQLGIFAQNDFAAVPDRLHLIAGLKVERNPYGGSAVEPSLKLAWTPDRSHTLWLSASRAARVPSRSDQNVVDEFLSTQPDLPFPLLMVAQGQQTTKLETALSYEAGTRFGITRKTSFDVATFFTRYDHLQAGIPGDPVLVPGEQPYFVMPLAILDAVGAHSWGGEVAADYVANSRWRLSPGFSYLRVTLQNPPGVLSLVNPGESPRHQEFLRSSFDVTRRLSLDAQATRVDRLPGQGLPAYARFDAKLAWRPLEMSEFSINIENLFNRQHDEWEPVLDPTGYFSNESGRSIYGKITWRF